MSFALANLNTFYNIFTTWFSNHRILAYIILALVITISVLGLYLLFGVRYIEGFDDNVSDVAGTKIAFLFLTRDNLRQPDIWKSYLAGHENEYTIYNHAKTPEKVNDIILSGHGIPDHVETGWGTLGTVRANILMMKAALNDPANEYFILCSESCVPVASFNKFYTFLQKPENKNKSYIPYFSQSDERYDALKTFRVNRDMLRKHCAQGMIFCRRHAELLVNNDDLDNWSKVVCVDEHYFYNTLLWLGVDPDKEIIKYKATFDIWTITNNNGHANDPAYPKIDHDLAGLDMPGYADFSSITQELVNKINAAGFFFFRKIGTNLQPNSKQMFLDIISQD